MKARLSPQEGLQLIGQIAVWRHLSNLPPYEAIRLNLADCTEAVARVKQHFRQLAQTTESDNVRKLFETRVSIIKELRDQELFDLIRSVADALEDLGADAFADELAHHWVPVQRHTQILSADLADLILKIAQQAQKTERAVFLGASSEAVAVAATRQGVMPKLVSPYQATLILICALLRDVPAQVEERHPFTQSSERAPDESTPTIAVPARLGRTEADQQARYAARSDLVTDEGLYVEHVLRHTTAVAVVLVSTRLLFARGPEAALRQELVGSGRLRAVISFPAGLLEPNYVPFTLLVLGQKQSDNHTVFCAVDDNPYLAKHPGKLRAVPRRFIDQSQLLTNIREPQSPRSRKVSSTEIAKLDFDLTVRKYVSTQIQAALNNATGDRPCVRLDELVKIVKPQALPSSTDEHNRTEIGEVSPAELPNHGYVTRGARTRLIATEDLRRNARQILNQGDLLLSVKGVIGYSAAVMPETDPIVPSQAFVILRLRKDALIKKPTALLMYLRSPLFQSQLESAVTGTTISNISLTDLGQLPVIIPTQEQQMQLHLLFEHQANLQQQIDAIRERQQADAATTWNGLGLAPRDLPT